MENDSFPPSSETNTAAPNSPRFAMAVGSASNQTFTDISPDTRDFGTHFFSMYRATVQPQSPQIPSSLSLTPSTRSSSIGADGEENATERRLNLARLILESKENNYDLIQKHLQDLNKEVDFLRHENAELRSINSELLELISSRAAFRSLLLSSGLDDFSDISPTSVMETNRFERRNPDQRVTLPKSISVRSTGYQKVNPGLSREGPSRASTKPRTVPTQSVSGTQRVYVPGVNGTNGSSSSGGIQKEEQENLSGLEMEVYNQGMFKTELCNKWQQTGACPYGEHCQFAHGLDELRPVIRHPRYKTEICRMVLAGDPCPYGHRCHFRHSLTEQEKLMLPH
uniref:C3H1-type domain-containing protein n=1 Tax=Cannabis sativa TaxID=3483 RepID=A0A803Q640_CANSA